MFEPYVLQWNHRILEAMAQAKIAIPNKAQYTLLGIVSGEAKENMVSGDISLIVQLFA